MTQNEPVQVAVIGGTGFYQLLDDAVDHHVTTPYGEPSAPIAVGSLGARKVAFLPRHGRDHQFAPHTINYRANLWALAALGVRQVLAPCAVGALTGSTGVGDLIVPSQLVDRTSGRAATFVERGAVHAPLADPYCARLASAVGADPEVTVGATMVVIDGPRFSTRAESRSYAASGWSLINMTGQPEAVLARELRLCYTPIALVTDHDAGAHQGDGVSQESVLASFAENLPRLKRVVIDTVGRLPDPDGCPCATWADGIELDYLP